MKNPSKNLIDRVLIGTATEQEAEFVAEWFASDEGQKYLNENMDEYFNNIQSGFEEIYVDHTIPSANIFDVKSEEKQTPRRISFTKVLLQIAAVLLPLIAFSGVTYKLVSSYDLFGTSEMAEIYVPKGEQQRITLPDGTEVQLNADTRFRYPKEFHYQNRKVELLAGEAYFDVKKDKKRPFYVNLSDATIKVLGTSFNVNTYADTENIIVTLDEGRVKLISDTDSDYDLYPQQQLQYNKNSKEVKILNVKHSNTFSNWKKDIISFHNTSLQNVINTLSRQYNVDFKVMDEQAYNYSFTLISENEPLNSILHDLEKISPLNFRKTDQTIEIGMK